ncbi:Scr1 family TA system antitoxin-like transcriptional regulator [Streptomyces gamaensis]|uniref:Scr1 family TA system antitoxin-like transcriptional regulator n=1 Tax=Streptomyces gamaensis TaxID=1763542 RepID=A0ABW0Z7R2_9ACTN
MSRRRSKKGPARSNAAVFGELLRYHREAAGFTQDALAAKLPCDRSLVARVEAGTRVPQEPFVKRCDELLGTGGELHHLWRHIDWSQEVEHPDWFQRRVDMEKEAASVLEYQEQVVTGLLQTEEYARALFSSVASHDPELVDKRVQARLSRQHRFLQADGPLLITVLDESCIRNVVKSPGVMHRQCAHLLAVGERPNIRIQVAPVHAADLIRMATSMSIITLPDGHAWVYSESLDRGHFNDAPAIVSRHSRRYDVLRADALSASDSAALIREAMEGYRLDEHPQLQCGDMEKKQLQPGSRRQLHRNRPRYPRLRRRA